MAALPQLFPMYPDGFDYFEEAISPGEESALLAYFERIEYHAYVMHGQPSRRMISRFGHTYGPAGGAEGAPPPLSTPLLRLREECAAVARLDPGLFDAALVTRYIPGAGIGWHSDLPVFGPVVFGVSLKNSCTFKLRPKSEPRRVFQISLAPRSLYVMSGEARSHWDHSIPPVRTLRYSVTYRSLRSASRR